MPPPRKLSLLVVDDEPMVADVTRRILERLGHTVRVSTRPEEVSTLWSEMGHSVDLVICDVAMAPLRGPDLIAQLSQSHKPPKVLFITGYSEEALHSELSHPVLAKPFTASTLSRAIDDIVF